MIKAIFLHQFLFCSFWSETFKKRIHNVSFGTETYEPIQISRDISHLTTSQVLEMQYQHRGQYFTTIQVRSVISRDPCVVSVSEKMLDLLGEELGMANIEVYCRTNSLNKIRTRRKIEY